MAAAKGFAVMDANALLRDVADADGYTADGIKFSATYVSGGLFSLDGVHPTAQGYAVVANQFIRVFNSTYNAQIPLINVATVPGSFVLTKSVKFDKYGIPIIPPGLFDNLQF